MKKHLLTLISLLGLSVLLAGGASIAQETTTTQESAIVGVPDFVKAGEVLSFTIKLDKAPSFEGGVVQFQIGPMSTGCQVQAGSNRCPVHQLIPATAKAGKWVIHISGFWTGTDDIPIKASDVSFEVIANSNLVFPTAAEIQINPSQVQLFRKAAFTLQLRVQNFKATLAQHEQDSPTSLDTIIRRNVSDALDSLKMTQSAFRELGGATAQADNERVFFDDLRFSYEEVLTGLGRDRAKTTPTSGEPTAWGSLLETVQRKDPKSNYSIVTQASLRPFEQNEAAYNLAADTQSLTFDLSVSSNPAGASVCYHRRGDPCHQNPDATNTTIKSLPLAIWMVKFEKPGYKTEEREHDPFREPNHVINVDLKP